VVLDQLGALLLDQDRAGAEVGVVVVGDLGDDGLDRLGLDAGLGGVVDTAGQVAVGLDLDGGGEQSNTVAVVTDGTAVLGLGDIGPAARCR
jgi:hypothetical protein